METKKLTANDYLVSVGGVNFVLVKESFGGYFLYKVNGISKTTISAVKLGVGYQATKEFSIAKGTQKLACSYKFSIMPNPTEHFSFAKAERELKISTIIGLLNIEKQQNVNSYTFSDDDINEVYNLLIKKARATPKNNLGYL